MNILEVAILGLLQGLSEFIPISSSGHLIIASKLFGTTLDSQDLNATIVFLHLGTLLALLAFYANKLKFVMDRPFHENRVDVIKIVFASIPAFAFGFIFSVFIEDELSLDLSFYMACISLIAAGSLFIFASRIYKGKNNTEISEMTNKQAFIIGLFQAIGVLYGVSRSGITLTGSRLVGLSNRASLDFAFIISIPLIAGAAFYSMLSSYEYLFNADNLLNSAVGFVVAFVSGYLAIGFLFRYLKNNNLNIFGAYCIIVGIASLVLNFLF